MRTFNLSNRFTPTRTVLLLLAAAVVFPQVVFAECQEFKIVEYEDRVEAVCVGAPLTEAQKKANLEEEKRQEIESQRQRNEELTRQREETAANKARTDAEAAAERKRRNSEQGKSQKPVNRKSTSPQIF